MSRIGKKAVPVPSGVTASVEGQTVKVKGPKGALQLVLHGDVEAWGLRGDRRWMVVDATGECVTAREEHRLLTVTADTPDTDPRWILRGIDLHKIATMLPSASGAECRAVCTEAGMYAIRARRKTIAEKDFLEAIQKVIKGHKKFSSTAKYMVYN